MYFFFIYYNGKSKRLMRQIDAGGYHNATKLTDLFKRDHLSAIF